MGGNRESAEGLENPIMPKAPGTFQYRRLPKSRKGHCVFEWAALDLKGSEAPPALLFFEFGLTGEQPGKP